MKFLSTFLFVLFVLAIFEVKLVLTSSRIKEGQSHHKSCGKESHKSKSLKEEKESKGSSSSEEKESTIASSAITTTATPTAATTSSSTTTTTPTTTTSTSTTTTSTSTTTTPTTTTSTSTTSTSSSTTTTPTTTTTKACTKLFGTCSKNSDCCAFPEFGVPQVCNTLAEKRSCGCTPVGGPCDPHTVCCGGTCLTGLFNICVPGGVGTLCYFNQNGCDPDLICVRMQDDRVLTGLTEPTGFLGTCKLLR